jgi:hypothetical protein
MKRKDFRRRPISFPEPFVRPVTGAGVFFPLSAANEKSRPRARKIFIIKQARRLASTNGTQKKLRRILIFDDHPDSLRLVFGHRANPHVDPSAPERVSSLELILVSILMIGGLVGMFWPLL